MRLRLLLSAVTLMVALVAGAGESTLATTGLWYGPVLRAHFPLEIPIHGSRYPIDEIPCLPKDITKFHLTNIGISNAFGRRAFSVSGKVTLGALPPPFKTVNAAKGPTYMLHLQAYLFSPSGKLVWQQQGFPEGGAWVSDKGQSAGFTLINSYSGSTSGYELIVLAAGDPVLSDEPETRVILGMKRVTLR